ncbi:MAG: hypothetical protein WA060_01165 [Minisyncoccia bacterium]
MSKRNFILLIIILIITILVVFGFLYLQQGTGTLGEEGEGTNFISQFNPFGTGGKSPTTPKGDTPTDVSGYEPGPEQEEVKLKKVSSMPVAGFTVYTKERLVEIPPVVAPTTPPAENTTTPEETTPKTTTTTKPTPPATEFVSALRYVDRATGNIYQTFADKIEERKFSGTMIPKVYEAFFGNKGESVIMRYLKEDGNIIITFVGNLPKEVLGGDTTGENEITGTFLPEDIRDVSLSGDKGSILYLFEVGENIVGTTLNLTTNKKSQIFDSPFTEWLPEWPNNKLMTLTTKPAASVPGFVYGVDPINNKNLHQIFGNINGLTTLTSPDGKSILYGNNNLALGIYHTDTKTSEVLGVRTLPEKCVWGSVSDVIYCGVPKVITGAGYPDIWYRGEVSFGDQFWKIDLTTGNATLLLDPTTVEGGEETDSIKLALDTEENYLFFVNKKDSFLWELELK